MAGKYLEDPRSKLAFWMGESSEKHETKSDFSVAMFDYQRVKPTRTAISWGANNLGWFNDRGFHWFHSQFPHASNAYKSV